MPRGRRLRSPSPRPADDRERAGSPAVSVVLTTYERREYVRRAVDSVLAQRYGHFELIVVDDGSTDGTAEALADLGPGHTYRWQPNRGVAAARNLGLRLASGSLVAFLDSDNRWLPHHLEVVVDALDRHPDAVLACTCPHFRLAGVPRGGTRLVDALPLLLLENYVGWSSSVAVRRDALVEAGGFCEELPVAEDTDLWVRLAARGPFVVVDRRTVVRTETSGSLMGRARRAGRYLDAYERIAQRGVALVERLARPDRAQLAARAEGRRRYVAGLRALVEGDQARARAELGEACRLVPELGSQPWLAARRIEVVSRNREERLANLAAAAAAWPDRGSDTALFLRGRAAAAALRAGRPGAARRLLAGWPLLATPGYLRRTLPLRLVLLRAALRRRAYRGREPSRRLASGALASPDPPATGVPRWLALLQRAVLRTERGPLRPLWTLGAWLLVRSSAAYLGRGLGERSAYTKGGLGAGDEPVFGISDVDILLVFARGAEQRRWRVKERRERLVARLPWLRALLEVCVVDEPGLGAAAGATYATYGLRRHPGTPGPGPAAFLGAEPLADASSLLTRPGLYGPMWDWRLVAGRERRPPADAFDTDERRLAAWLELQFWWRYAVLGCVAPERSWVPYLCVKLVAEPARTWLWLAHGEQASGRRQALERARELLRDEADAFAAALELHGALPRAPRAPLVDALRAFVRLTARIAGLLGAEAERAGLRPVRLERGDGDPLLPASELEPLSALLGGAPPLLPLADWRARAVPGLPDEAFTPVDRDPSDPAALAAAALAGRLGPYPALRADCLLVLPTASDWRRSALRAVQCPATDPVSFALADGLPAAGFPELPGLSARDCALRAVAEHRAWLGLPAGLPPPRTVSWIGGQPPPGATVDALGALVTAARAALFLESVEAGDPELALTAAATCGRLAERTGARAAAESALDALRACRLRGADPPARTVAALEELVRSLPAYAAASVSSRPAAR